MIKQLFYALFISTLASSANAQSFTLAPPSNSQLASAASLSLWSTQYYVHLARESAAPDAIPLASADGQSFVSVSQHDWCNAAMEGTVSVQRTAGNLSTYNYSTLGPRVFTDCGNIFHNVSASTKEQIRRSVFVDITRTAPFGLGTGGYKLVPFRTVAVDRSKTPIGTALYIPALRGILLHMPDGTTATHDGYVLAADTGNEIKDNHVDFFTGVYRQNPAPAVVRSNPAYTFKAYVIADPDVVRLLQAAHR